MPDGFASIRLFCVVAPTRSHWGKKSLNALKALDRSGLGVRAVPILGHMMQFHLPGYEDWQPFDHLFVTSIGDRYVNVICAPARFDLGRKVSVGEVAPRQAATADGQPIASHVTAERSGDDREAAYTPETALRELVTVRPGVTNVAVTETAPAPLESELQSLRQCAAVLVPSQRQAQKLRSQFICQVIVDEGEEMGNLVKVATQILEGSDDGGVGLETSSDG